MPSWMWLAVHVYLLTLPIAAACVVLVLRRKGYAQAARVALAGAVLVGVSSSVMALTTALVGGWGAQMWMVLFVVSAPWGLMFGNFVLTASFPEVRTVGLPAYALGCGLFFVMGVLGNLHVGPFRAVLSPLFLVLGLWISAGGILWALVAAALLEPSLPTGAS